MRTRNLLFAGAACLALACGSAVAGDTDVDLELVLAVDVSRSMDPGEQELQKQGYVAALQHPDVLEAIREGFLGRIAVTYVEWAGPGLQRIIAPWTIVDGAEFGEGAWRPDRFDAAFLSARHVDIGRAPVLARASSMGTDSAAAGR